MEFAIWLEENEINEGLRDVISRIKEFLRGSPRAGKLQFSDTIFALKVLKNKLFNIFGDEEEPTEQQLRFAWKTLRDVPKVGLIILSIFNPFPGPLIALLLASMAFKKLFNISILPSRFDKLYNKLIDKRY